MSTPRSAHALLAAALLLVACSGSDAAPPPTAPTAAPPSQHRDAAAGSGSGAVVDRVIGVDLGFLSILDAESGIGFTLGLRSSLATYCATGALSATRVTVQTVATPSGNFRFLAHASDAPIVVYDYSGGVPSLDPCDLVGRTVLATGTGGMTQTGLPPNGYDAAAHGTVTLIGGGRAQLTGTEHYRSDAGGVPVVRSVVRLRGAGSR